MTDVKADFSGAIKKTKTLLNVPKANKYQGTKWASETVKELKKSAQSMKKTKGRKTGNLARNVGMDIATESGKWKILLGTGLSGAKSVVYAKIQDVGGKIKPKRKKFLAVPLPGVKGMPANYPDAFIIKSKNKNLLIVERKGRSGLKLLFALKKEVTLPPSLWFTAILKKRTPILTQMLSPAAVLKRAEEMK